MDSGERRMAYEALAATRRSAEESFWILDTYGSCPADEALIVIILRAIDTLATLNDIDLDAAAGWREGVKIR